MTKVDLIALGFVAITAFIGWKKGLISTALSLAGIVLASPVLSGHVTGQVVTVAGGMEGRVVHDP
jgi:3-oxoacyl-[acyl-carrier protein] reductase